MPNMISNKALSEITGEVKSYLRFLSGMGCKGFECSDESMETVGDWGTIKPICLKKNPGPETLAAIQDELGGCKRCSLAAKRLNLVFGAGNPNARIVFVGDAPDSEEDMQGQPFVGVAGQLLTRMLQAMGLNREDVYICNIIKCRPVENTMPRPEEVLACTSFFERQIQVIKPEIICTLGAFATQVLLDKPEGVSGLRGQFQNYKGIRVMPTFHPAFLLRNPASKKEAWEDLQKIIAVLGLQVKTK